MPRHRNNDDDDLFAPRAGRHLPDSVVQKLTGLEDLDGDGPGIDAQNTVLKDVYISSVVADAPDDHTAKFDGLDDGPDDDPGVDVQDYELKDVLVTSFDTRDTTPIEELDDGMPDDVDGSFDALGD